MSMDRQEEQQFDKPIMEPPLLNISGRRSTKPHRVKQNKKTSATSAEQIFDNKLFPLMLSKILLKPEPPVNTKLAQYDHRYLGVLCLKNKKTNIKIYHMFPTRDSTMRTDYDNTRKIYDDKPDIQSWNNVTTEAICPETLRRSAVTYFSNEKWNKDGNIMEAQFDEWDLSNKLQELRMQQIKNLFNYIKFLKMSKS
ncbi:hypothetical protein KR215_009751 [Drosophila sulfurigaster]|nr:hypothetical protein KR215_009751 [Drosophila sulfurigaster]